LFGHTIRGIVAGMARLRDKIAAEHTVRELLCREGIPAPDRIEYGHACIRCFWDEAKVALVVDIDEFAHADADLMDIDPFPR
jgi:hypothetical protein